MPSAGSDVSRPSAVRAVVATATATATVAVAVLAGCGPSRSTATPPVTVAVVDTGAAPVGSLAGRLVDGVRCAPTCSPGAGPDVDGHGTAVADLLVTGGDPDDEPADVAVLPVRVSDDRGALSVPGVAAGIRWTAEQGVPVVALPLVLGGDGDVSDSIRSSPQTLFVVPAGNDGLDVDEQSVPVHPCVDPAPNVLCVAASDAAGRLSDSSNRGRTSVDLAAPGVDLRTLDPAGRTVRVSGTSFSVPLVARAAAGLLAARPGTDPATLAGAIRCGVRPSVPPNDTAGGGVLDVARAAEALSGSAGRPDGAADPSRPCRGSLG